MDAGAIVGIVLGAVALALLIGFMVYMYWWVPHHNRTHHHEGQIDVEMDEKIRKRLMAEYDVPEKDEDANVSMTEGAAGFDFGDLP